MPHMAGPSDLSLELKAPELSQGFPGGSHDEESACNAGYLDSVPGSERSPGGGHGNPFQYSCLKNSMDRERILAVTVHGVI